MLKLNVTFRKIYREPTEICATKVKNCRMTLPIGVMIVVNFLPHQTDRNNIWNIALVFWVLFTILTIKILGLLKII